MSQLDGQVLPPPPPLAGALALETPRHASTCRLTSHFTLHGTLYHTFVQLCVSLHLHGHLCAARSLTVKSPPAAAFVLETVVELKPKENTLLEGLYKSGGNFSTQVWGSVGDEGLYKSVPMS